MYKDVVDLIINVGFPIGACIAMAIYIKILHTGHREDIRQLNEEHRKEVNGLRAALENNTLAINTLVERLTNEDK